MILLTLFVLFKVGAYSAADIMQFWSLNMYADSIEVRHLGEFYFVLFRLCFLCNFNAYLLGLIV